MSDFISFNVPYMTGRELFHIAEAHFKGKLSGDGSFTKLCHNYIEKISGTSKALLTHSCTAALEMQSLLVDINHGDEVIMPAFTFVSTANAVVLRGGKPVFVDIRPDTLNIDENLIEEAITPATKAIAPVHYAGVGCEMDKIMDIAKLYNLMVIEDAAQGFMSYYKDKMLGSIGHLGAWSFHETKNVISGEGGALLVNDPFFVQRAEIIREKGTDRSRFLRGEIDKYTWQDIGSSYLPGEIIAAFLWAQLEDADSITQTRLKAWNLYHEMIEPLEDKELLRRPIVPANCTHNAHMYYILLSPEIERQRVLNLLKKAGINSVIHYIPLHSSPAGSRFGRFHGNLTNTVEMASRLIRLPLFHDITQQDIARVCDELTKILTRS